MARRLFAPVDAASLAAFRIAFGALMLVAVLRYFAHGWIEQVFVAPQVFFPYPGLEWVVPLPPLRLFSCRISVQDLCGLRDQRSGRRLAGRTGPGR